MRPRLSCRTSLPSNPEAIHDYISEFDCVANAYHVLDGLMDFVESPSKYPQRGIYPEELVGLGIKEYRQTFFKPYRVIYRVTGSQVINYLIADGRRGVQTVLACSPPTGRLTRSKLRRCSSAQEAGRLLVNCPPPTKEKPTLRGWFFAS